MELRKTFRFEASHILPKHPGKCSRLHGHSWVLHVYVEGKIDPVTHFVQDYADISEVVKPLVEQLDHRHLGQWQAPPIYELDSFPVDLAYGQLNILTKDCWRPENIDWQFYPSSENLLVWIAQQLTPLLNWSKLQLEETCTSLATLTREEYPTL